MMKKTVLDLKKHLIEEMKRFPRHFDQRMWKGLDRLLSNSAENFLEKRCVAHVKRILLTQYFLQKKIEESLSLKREGSKSLFVKLFRHSSSRICLSYTSSTERERGRESLFKVIQTLIPSIQEVPDSFYTWTHPTFPYIYTYFEIQKIRGKEPSNKELKIIRKDLVQRLSATSPLTPALFWPYNKEDSFRQIQLLRKEVKSPHDLLQVSIHFHEQTATTLEFLIHVSRPAGKQPLEDALRKLPNSFIFFSEFHRLETSPFPIEIGAFSLKVPSFPFEFSESINLLYARRYIAKQIEIFLGPFRDINGGLLEIQQSHFEQIRNQMGDRIPYFELFAEKLFYALHPMETWLNLTMDEVEELFSAFSSLIQDEKKSTVMSTKSQFAIIRKENELECMDIVSKMRGNASCVYVCFGDSYFVCLFGSVINFDGITHDFLTIQAPRHLSLVFQEGMPPSLNPQFALGDMRSKILSKLLFEGLTRLDGDGNPLPAGAESWEIDKESRIYTFKLKPTYWSNGERVTASDYKSSWERALSDSLSHPEPLFILKNGRLFREGRSPLGVQALTPSLLQIELEQSTPYFLHQLAQPVFFPLLGSIKEPKWFNGPYLLRERDREGISLEKNAYFWNAKNLHLDQIHIHWRQNGSTFFELFEKNQIDWIGDPLVNMPRSYLQKMLGGSQLKTKSVKRRLFIYFNTQHPLLTSPLVRQAFKLCIDPHVISEQIFPLSTPCTIPKKEKNEIQLLFRKGLRSLGLELESLPALTFSYSSHPGRNELANYLQSVWFHTLGLSIETACFPWDEFRNRLEDRNFEICCTIQDTQNEGSREYYERFEGSTSWNFSQWSSSQYRNLLSQNQLDVPSLTRLLEEEAPFFPLLNYVHIFMHNPELEGYRIDSEGCVDFSYSFFK